MIEQTHAAEARLYTALLQAAAAALATYQARSGARINPTDTTPADIAAAALVIILERHEEPTGDNIRQASYEAARRAARTQRKHQHEPEEEAPQRATQGPQEWEIMQAIQRAGPIAALMAQGYTLQEISRATGQSITATHRRAQRAREQIARELF